LVVQKQLREIAECVAVITNHNDFRLPDDFFEGRADEFQDVRKVLAHRECGSVGESGSI
jgi:hypothetical protein